MSVHKECKVNLRLFIQQFIEETDSYGPRGFIGYKLTTELLAEKVYKVRTEAVGHQVRQKNIPVDQSVHGGVDEYHPVEWGSLIKETLQQFISEICKNTA